MEKQLHNLFVPISRQELSVLTTEVKEVLAKDCMAAQQKIFSAADLWNIRRQKRKNTGRRFLV
ncbi:MAG: hypothetical protein QM791_20310 [Ferruginibacter sp.]